MIRIVKEESILFCSFTPLLIPWEWWNYFESWHTGYYTKKSPSDFYHVAHICIDGRLLNDIVNCTYNMYSEI